MMFFDWFKRKTPVIGYGTELATNRGNAPTPDGLYKYARVVECDGLRLQFPDGTIAAIPYGLDCKAGDVLLVVSEYGTACKHQLRLTPFTFRRKSRRFAIPKLGKTWERR